MVIPFSPRNKALGSAGAFQRNAIGKAKEIVAKGELYRASKREAPSTPRAKRDPLIQLKNNLLRFTRNNDRKMVLRTLEDCKLLKNIMMETVKGPLADNTNGWLKLEEEVAQTRIVLNDLFLGGPSVLQKKEMFLVLEKLCETLASSTNDLTTENLFQAVILRLARSATANDAHFQLNALLGSPDLMLLPTSGDFTTSSKLDIFRSHDGVHLKCETTHSYGLLRKVDLSTRAKRPWICLLVTVHERANLTSKQSVRYCTVKVAEKAGIV